MLLLVILFTVPWIVDCYIGDHLTQRLRKWHLLKNDGLTIERASTYNILTNSFKGVNEDISTFDHKVCISNSFLV